MVKSPYLKATRLLCLAALVVGATNVFSQSDKDAKNAQIDPVTTYVPHMTFDVASIREDHESTSSFVRFGGQDSTYFAEGVSPVGLVHYAYDIQILALLKNMPPWAFETKYTISAKSDAAADEALAKLSEADYLAEKRHMLQMLLQERFHLKIHSEQRTSKVYDLETTERTAKLMTPAQGELAKTVGTCAPRFSKKGIELVSLGCPFSIFFGNLKQELGTEVVDYTGMTGVYSYHLMWYPMGLPSKNDPEEYPRLVDAMREQLGLVLKPGKGLVTYWVVDRIERPTPN